MAKSWLLRKSQAANPSKSILKDIRLKPFSWVVATLLRRTKQWLPTGCKFIIFHSPGFFEHFESVLAVKAMEKFFL
jgi:hypothetical protein